MLRLDPELMPGDRRIASEDGDVRAPRISAEADVELVQRLQGDRSLPGQLLREAMGEAGVEQHLRRTHQQQPVDALLPVHRDGEHSEQEGDVLGCWPAGPRPRRGR